MPVAVSRLLITGAEREDAETVMTRVAVPVPLALTAAIATVKDPDAAAVPLITPVLVFRIKPAGRPLAEKAVGVPLAVIA